MGMVVTGFLIVYMLYFIIPVGKTAYNTELAAVNQSSPYLQQILPFTNNWWYIFPPLILIAGGYTIWQYLTNRDAFDY